ncbi:signal peptidase II [Promicromonospora thailandica]|uniref:Lipoprotein signal peptidase n=1 Tax=Promicromonospora thailandica TaxID=765201 RepID=A0A9X2FZ35_9MICO|nr:signal peptidase II [Promicromonospora thailandica]MCP2264007.1 signal peptidase II [Promicromonospora thailandica]BFF17658.1 signal peptidase II [Promicromonospora thailandica]
MSTPAEPSAVAGDATGPAPATNPSSGSRALVVWTGALAALVLAVDQLTKWWAESALVPNAPTIPVVGDLLGIRLIYNPGAALSIASGYTWILTIVVTVVVVFIVRAIGRLGSRGWAAALGLLLGGAVGNLVDRLAREPGFARGHVVDFIDYAGFFVGNVADIAVVAAAVLIALLSLRGIGLDGRRHTDERQGGETSDGAGSDGAGSDGTASDAAAGSAPSDGDRGETA